MSPAIRTVAALLLAVLALSPPGPASTIAAQRSPLAAPGPSVTVVRDGILLSLHVAHWSYPRNALIRYRLTIQNVSGHPLPLPSGGCIPLWEVQVLSSSGAVLDPPALPLGYPPPSCPPAVGREPRLPVHYQKTLRRLAVLRSGRLQATAHIGRDDTLISTPVLRLRTYPAPTPSLRLMSTGSWWARFISRRPGPRPFLFNATYICDARDGGHLAGSSGWTGGKPAYIQPKRGFPWCSSLDYLRLMAGYRGRPVADLTWQRPGWIP